MCYNRSNCTTAVTLTCNVCPECHQASRSVTLDPQVLHGFVTSCVQQILPESREHGCNCVAAGLYLWAASYAIVVPSDDLVTPRSAPSPWRDIFIRKQTSFLFRKRTYSWLLISEKLYLGLDFWHKNPKHWFEWRISLVLPTYAVVEKQMYHRVYTLLPSAQVLTLRGLGKGVPLLDQTMRKETASGECWWAGQAGMLCRGTASKLLLCCCSRGIPDGNCS